MKLGIVDGFGDEMYTSLEDVAKMLRFVKSTTKNRFIRW